MASTRAGSAHVLRLNGDKISTVPHQFVDQLAARRLPLPPYRCPACTEGRGLPRIGSTLKVFEPDDRQEEPPNRPQECSGTTSLSSRRPTFRLRRPHTDRNRSLVEQQLHRTGRLPLPRDSARAPGGRPIAANQHPRAKCAIG